MSGRTKDKTRNLAFSKLPAHHTYLKWTAYDRPKPCELLVVHSVIAILSVYLFMLIVCFGDCLKSHLWGKGFLPLLCHNSNWSPFYDLSFFPLSSLKRSDKCEYRKVKANDLVSGHVVRQRQEGWRQESKWPGQLPPTMLSPLPLSDFLPPVISS